MSEPEYRKQELYYKDLARQRGDSYALAVAADDVVKARAAREKAEETLSEIAEEVVKLREAWNDLDYSGSEPPCSSEECESSRAYGVCMAVIELERLAGDHLTSANGLRRAEPASENPPPAAT